MTFTNDYKTILSAFNWTNYKALKTNAPAIRVRRREARSQTPYEGIMLENSSIEYVQDHAGNVLYERQTGTISLWELSQSNLNAMIDDIKDELPDVAGEPFHFEEGEPDLTINNYTLDIVVERIKS